MIPALEFALSDRYRVLRELGRGGMATVFLAEDLRLHRQVALKVLRPDLAATLGNDRFLREIEIAARLSHPHILPLHDSGEAGGHLYYAMPYVDGESLRQRLEREGQLAIAEVIAIVQAVAGALTYAHQHGVIHRDIKPENILLAKNQDGDSAHPLIADFGIARALDAAGGERLTETGLALGTPAYMSPEQAAGGRIDSRSDIYALGCVAYEMLAGQPPFVGPTAQAILARHAVDPPPPIHTVRATVPGEVELAIERALCKVPADRFFTANEFAEALVAKPPRELWGLRRLIRRRHGQLVGVAAISAIGAGVLLSRSDASSAVVPSASKMAILPFLSPAGDTALARLGKDLATTISASLDGVGGIETADRLSIVANTADKQSLSPVEGAALGRRLGASSVVRGTLVWAGDQVRLDMGLYGTEGLAPLAQGITVTAHRDSITTLTDSASWGLLRQVWQRGEPPSPSLAAVTTRSLPALRAFLAGERHIEKAEWKSAALAFRSAIAADSTFWLAYLRHFLARHWTAAVAGADAAGGNFEQPLLTILNEHKNSLPEREQLLVEALATDSMSRDVELLREVTRRFPDYWPGWFHYGDFLYHLGPVRGHSWKDAQQVLGRAVALNSRLKPAYHHLFWNSAGKDSAERELALARFLALPGMDPLDRRNRVKADLQHMRLINALDRTNGDITPEDSALADSVAKFYVSKDIEQFQKVVWPVNFLWAWNPAGQISFNRRILRYATDPTSKAHALRTNAWAWAERGQWDSALSSVLEAGKHQPDQIASDNPNPTMLFEAYSLSVLGAFLGALPPQQAAQHRPAAIEMIKGLEDVKQTSELQGSLAWLDGLLAYVLRNGAALKDARETARRSGRPDAEIIDRSLATFGRALRGNRHAAALDLVVLDRHCAENYYQRCGRALVPNIAAHRLSAATWLLEAGDTAQAARLLIWPEARFTIWNWSWVVRPHAYLMLARIEEARGQTQLAKEHYQQFLRHYDSPMPAKQHLVDEARAALARLAGTDPP